MGFLIVIIGLFAAGFAIASMLYRDELIDLRYRVGAAEWERQKQFWAHNYAAKRLGVDIESEEWYRALQEEEAEFERQHPHHAMHKRRWGRASRHI